MVPVAPFVMEPGGGVSILLPLGGIGAANALIISGASPELSRGVLRKVMGQTLTNQADSKAVDHHQQPVVGNGFKMSPWFHCKLLLG